MKTAKKIEYVNIDTLKENENNPRTINDEYFEKLKKSISKFSKMLEVRPLIVNKDNIVIAGNMRLKACKELDIKKVPIIKANDFTEEELKELMIKDNLSFGEWDYNSLFEEFNLTELDDFGFNTKEFKIDLKIDDEDDNYNDEQVEVMEYTLMFFSREEQEIWLNFLNYLKNKYKEIKKENELILYCIFEYYKSENMINESEEILKILKRND